MDIDAKLEDIGRKFVHRKTTGYKEFSVLMEDLLPVVQSLPVSPAQSEYWVRVANDVADYLGAWNDSLDEDDVKATLNTLKQLETRVVNNRDIFTVTQNIRLNSIAVRSRSSWAALVPEEDWQDIYELLISGDRSDEPVMGNESL